MLKLRRKSGPKPVPVWEPPKGRGAAPFPEFYIVRRKAGILKVDPQIFEWRRRMKAAKEKAKKEAEKKQRIEEEAAQRGKIWRLFE